MMSPFGSWARTGSFGVRAASPLGERWVSCTWMALVSGAPEMLSFHREPIAYPTDPHNEDNLRRPVLTGNAGKWRTAMAAREVRIFEALAGTALEQHGYPRAQPEATISRLEQWSCRAIESPPRRLLSLLRNRQGHRQVLETVRLRLLMRYRC